MDAPAPTPPPGFCQTENAIFVVGPEAFDIQVQLSILGLISRFQYVAPKTLEIRRMMQRGPRLQETLLGLKKQYGGSASLGLFIRDTDPKRFALAVYYTNIQVLDSQESLSPELAVVEDVVLLSFDSKQDVLHMIPDQEASSRPSQ